MHNSPQYTGIENRNIQRISLALPIRVFGNGINEQEWSETTQLRDVSAFGAGFSLKQPVNKGCLIRLEMPLPQKLRSYDLAESLYSIWAIIRHSILLPSSEFAYGMAFIGKNPPASYLFNPQTVFEVTKQEYQGLWHIVKSDDATNIRRQHTRHVMPLSVVIQQFSENGELISSEQSVTENVSISGASVFSTVKAEIGSFVRFSCGQYNMSIISVVRNRRIGEDGFPRLHLEFVDQQLPIEHF